MQALRSITFNISKEDKDKQLVFGWASIAEDISGNEVVDLQGDIISPDDLEEAAYDHVLHFRNTGERHNPDMRKKGRLVESVVFTKEKQKALGIPDGLLPVGWWVGYKIDDPEAWERIKSGDYKAFSVEGKGERTPIEKSAKTFAKCIDFSIEKEYNITKAQTFSQCIAKYNPYHDSKGRFSSSTGATSFTFNPNSKAGAKAIEREKQRMASQRITRSLALEKSLAKVEGEIASRKTEKLVALDDKGNIVFEKSGTKKKVTISDGEYSQMKGSVLTHNHPIQDWLDRSCFSASDIETGRELSELRMVYGSKTYSLKFNGGDIDKSTTRYKVDNIEQQYQQKVRTAQALYKRNAVDYETYEQLHKKATEKYVDAVNDFLRENQTKYNYIFEEGTR